MNKIFFFSRCEAIGPQARISDIAVSKLSEHSAFGRDRDIMQILRMLDMQKLWSPVLGHLCFSRLAVGTK
jgi:hypothetical protein